MISVKNLEKNFGKHEEIKVLRGINETVKKGDMLGWFLFGGSDYVMLFQKEAGFELTAPIENQEGGFEHIFMGEEYGRFGGAEQSA